MKRRRQCRRDDLPSLSVFEGVSSAVAQIASNDPIEDKFHVDEAAGFFGCFDGHGGTGVSEFLSKRLKTFIHANCSRGANIEEALNRAFMECDQCFMQEHVRPLCQDLSGETLHAEVDSAPLSPATIKLATMLTQGSCALVALVREGELWIGNVGDSRAVLGRCTARGDGSHEYRCEVVSRDHNTRNHDEVLEVIKRSGDDNAIRTEMFSEDSDSEKEEEDDDEEGGSGQDNDAQDRAGAAAHGSAVQDIPDEHSECHDAAPPSPSETPKRVAGSLMVTRAFGDVYLKAGSCDGSAPFAIPMPAPLVHGVIPHTTYITAMPDVMHVALHMDSPLSDFLVLATDGLWDEMTSEEVVAAVAEYVPQPCAAAASSSNSYARAASTAATALINRVIDKVAKPLGLNARMLSRLAPGPARRLLHDDITVAVVFLSPCAARSSSSHPPNTQAALPSTAAPHPPPANRMPLHRSPDSAPNHRKNPKPKRRNL